MPEKDKARPSILDRPRDDLESMYDDVVPPDPGPGPDVHGVDPLPGPDPSEMEPGELAAAIVSNLSDEDLAALPEVQAAIEDPDIPVREEVRQDLEDAALGAMVEAEREEAARQAVEEENAVAPSQEEVDALYTFPEAPVPDPNPPEAEAGTPVTDDA